MTLANFIGKLNVKPENDTFSIFDRECKFSDRIAWEYFITPEIFVTKQGELGAVIKIDGIPFEVQDEIDLNFKQSSLGYLLQSLGDEFGVYVTTYRHLEPSYLSDSFPEGFSSEFARAYQKQFEGAQLYLNDIYITLMLKSGSTAIKKGSNWFKKLSLKNDKELYSEWRQSKLKKFKNGLYNFSAALKDYSPKILGKFEFDNALPIAEPLSFLSIFVNGKKRDITYPLQSISKFVPETRIFIGYDTLHFQSPTKNEEKFGAILSIKEYTPHTANGMFNELLTVPFEYINTHSFLSIDKHKAIDMLDKQARLLTQTNDAAKSQVKMLKQAKDDIASGKIAYGLHHNTILVLANTIKELEDRVAIIIKIYQEKRLIAIRETLNLESAFLSQIPGNSKYIKRTAPISTNNFSCFCSLHNYYSGYKDANHLGSALMLVETPSKTPLYLNLHEKASGRKDDLSKGHTTIIGPTGSGKTVILTVLATMISKYNFKVIFLDRNNGAEISIRAKKGVYNGLNPGQPTGWNPFKLPNTPKNRKFLQNFLEVLCTSDIQLLTVNDLNQIADVVDRAYTLAEEDRNLSNIYSFFRLDFSGLAALSRYTRLKDRGGRAGDRFYLFDNDEDSFNLDPQNIGFDLTHWVSDAGESPEELYPILMYIMHRVEECLGKPLLLVIDEGWQVLQKPYLASKIEEALVTWRKLNGLIIFATQLPDKVAKSKIGSALIQGSATNIYLPNPKAEEKDYIDAFKLSPKEFEIIKNTSPQSRYFLIKQGHEAAIGRMNLSDLEKYTAVLSGTTQTVSLCNEIRKEVGEDPDNWLPIFYERNLK